MRISCLSLLLLSWFVTPYPAIAAVSTLPDALTVTTDRQAIEKRQVVVQTTAAMQNLRVVPLDLSRSDGVGVLPANAITVELPAEPEIAANGTLSVPVEINLSSLRTSGEFSGVLLFQFEGGQHRLPITVKVKDHFSVPFGVLLLGVIVGMAVSAYLQEGRNRDETVVHMSRLRTEMQSDQTFQNLGRSFYHQANGFLRDAETALNYQRWEAAQTNLQAGQAVWDKWCKGQDDWTRQLSYRQQLVDKLQNDTFDQNGLYYQTLQVNLETIAIKTADYDSPQSLQQALTTIAQQMDRYRSGRVQLEQLDQQRNQLQDFDQAEIWQQQAIALENRLNALEPGNLEEFKSWQKDMQTALNELMTELSNQPEVRGGADGTGQSAVVSNPVSAIAPAPAAGELRRVQQAAQRARWRLRGFGGLAYLIALCLLTGAGFQKLYVTNPIFGATPFSDYFALLAWGFGSEATRQSIAKVVRGWGMAEKEQP